MGRRKKPKPFRFNHVTKLEGAHQENAGKAGQVPRTWWLAFFHKNQCFGVRSHHHILLWVQGATRSSWYLCFWFYRSFTKSYQVRPKWWFQNATTYLQLYLCWTRVLFYFGQIYCNPLRIFLNKRPPNTIDRFFFVCSSQRTVWSQYMAHSCNAYWLKTLV